MLLLEDEAMLRAAMRRGLERIAGLEVVDVGRVAVAAAYLQGARPDVIVSDLKLPDGTGLALLPLIVEVGPMPVVFVTAWFGTYEASCRRRRTSRCTRSRCRSRGCGRSCRGIWRRSGASRCRRSRWRITCSWRSWGGIRWCWRSPATAWRWGG